jgi:hypothetical protein
MTNYEQGFRDAMEGTGFMCPAELGSTAVDDYMQGWQDAYDVMSWELYTAYGENEYGKIH